jgi:hypothetical protein
MTIIKTFHLEINLGNEEMQDAEDIAFALERAARHIRSEEYSSTSTKKVFDRNGNKVGFFGIHETDDEDFGDIQGGHAGHPSGK